MVHQGGSKGLILASSKASQWFIEVIQNSLQYHLLTSPTGLLRGFERCIVASF